jgi:serine/threonine protein phosphatase PrpC
MLCSDGIMDGLWEDQIREVISSDESIDRITGELIDKSNKVDPTDDTTVIMAEIARI